MQTFQLVLPLNSEYCEPIYETEKLKIMKHSMRVLIVARILYQGVVTTGVKKNFALFYFDLKDQTCKIQVRFPFTAFNYFFLNSFDLFMLG